MPARLSSVEQLMPFPTAAELVAAKSIKGVMSIAPDTTVIEAMQLMADKNIGFLPVIANGVVAGVVSERDCARKVVLRQLAAGSTEVGTTVSTIMSTPVHSVPPQAKIPECIMLMHDKGIRHLPVMDASGILGVLSVRDLMAALIVRHERLLRRFQEERLTLLYPDPSSY